MAKAAAVRRRLGKFAMARSLLVLLGLALLAAAGCTGQRDRGAFTAAAWYDDDGDGIMEQRQEAMKEALKVFSGYNPASTPPEVLKRAVATMNGAMAPLRPIFKAISRMPETTAAEVRAKEEARAASHELLSRHLGQLLPSGSVEITEEMY